MSQVKLGDKNIPFIYQGNELLYPNPVKDGLVLYYDFKGMKNSDVTKGVAKDLTKNILNGSLKNFNYTEASGYKDGLLLDGVDDYVETIRNNAINNLTYTLSVELLFEIKKSDNTVLYLASNSESSTGASGFTIGYFGDSQGQVGLFYRGIRFWSTKNLELNKKYFLQVTVDESGNMKLFINGKLDKTTTSSIHSTRPSLNLFFGKAAFYNSPFTNFNIGDFKIYNRALTDQEIQHNYNLEKERWGL
ncbi:LamG domain-containing protein [Staphylococcus saprophyticus]|nr:LamG domain-containing protein [Staphylococcus saprophyticus]